MAAQRLVASVKVSHPQIHGRKLFCWKADALAYFFKKYEPEMLVLVFFFFFFNFVTEVKGRNVYNIKMHFPFTGNAPLSPNLHTVQDALHAAHKIGQKAPNKETVAASHKQGSAASVGALHHQKLHAPPQVPQRPKAADESGEKKPGRLQCSICLIRYQMAFG